MTVVLAINSGSSSVKYALFAMEGVIERRLGEGALPIAAGEDRKAAIDAAFDLATASARSIDVVGHRVVHGGAEHVKPVVVDGAVLSSLRRLVPFAPLHMPASIEGIAAVLDRHPETTQVACFDTSFHATLPEIARRLPLPDRFNDVRRYGFHGLSYEWTLSTLAQVPSRVVIAHLGNGSSVVAVKDGRAIDTTMGLTPTGGILMGTRSGDLDPGVLLYLARAKRLSSDAIEHIVDRESGLLAIGGTSDMRALLERAGQDPRARLAVEMFGYAVRKTIGAYAAVLGGIDLLVFTGGIGEHAAKIRSDACRGLGPVGVVLDETRNMRDEAVISDPESATVVRIVHADEDLVIARHAHQLLNTA